jgi:uncharacterized membrane protein
MSRWKTPLRYVLAVAMVMVGVTHFTSPGIYTVMVPSWWVQSPLTTVYVSGVAEIAGGVGLLIPQLRRAAAWGLILLYIAVFPANVNMAVNHIPYNGKQLSDAALWGRLPLQLVLIAWAHWYTRRDRPAVVTDSARSTA